MPDNLQQIAEQLLDDIRDRIYWNNETIDRLGAERAILSALRAVQRETLEQAAEEWRVRTELQAEHVYDWLRSRASTLAGVSTPPAAETE